MPSTSSMPGNLLTYVDRSSGLQRQEPIYAAHFLDWSYNSRTGRFLTDSLLNRRWVSSLYGCFQQSALSRFRIRPFVEKLEIDCSEIEKPLEAYSSFADFFERRLKPSARPIMGGPEECISPADCRALVFPDVQPHQTFRIKGGLFNLSRLVADESIAARFAGGSMFIGRLYLSDYHHFHFPVDGVAGSSQSIPGRYYAVSPYARSKPVPFYFANHRMVMTLASEQFGEVVMVEIGAFTVGSIVQQYRPAGRVERGQHKGYFGLGGSTVVLLFRPDTIEFDEDLILNSGRALETYVRMGESVGKSAA